MHAREDVVAAAEALRVELPRLRRLWPEVRWKRLQAELLEWLGTFERCRREEGWREAWSALVVLARSYDFLDYVESPPLYALTIPDIADPPPGPQRSHHDEDPLNIPRSVGELMARLYRLLDPAGSARHPPLEAYPEARVAGEVFEQQAFRLEVMVHAEPSTGASHKATLPRGHRGAVDLEVVLHLPLDGAITHRSPGHHPLRVPEGRDSNRVSFELFAVRPGRHRVDVRFLQSGHTRAEITVPVVALAADERPSAIAAPTAVSASLCLEARRAPRGLVLAVEQEGVGSGARSLFVSLNDYAAGQHMPSRHVVAEQSQESLVALCQRMRLELAVRQPEAREYRLRGIGAELAAKLLPPAVREELASDRYEQGTSLHIECRATWMPWELFFVGPPDRGRFLGEWFAVTRWHGHAQLRSDLAGSRAVLVAPRSSGLSIDDERRALERLTGVGVEELRTLHEVQTRLWRAPPIGFLHFACHGTASLAPSGSGARSLTRDATPLPSEGGAPLPPHPRGELLLEDMESLRTSDVPRSPKSPPAPLKGSCVFLNACQAGLPGSSPWGHEGWVNTFFDAGAVAVIAPSWTISDTCAGKFAKEFYAQLSAGETLGRAAWWARQKSREQGSEDALGYAIYAFPDACHARPPSPQQKELP